VEARKEISLAVTIRLKRVGKKNQPSYRVIAIDARLKRGGREKEVLGMYNPLAKGKHGSVVLERERVKYWLDCGAQVSDTMAGILKAQGLLPKRLERHAGVRNG